MPCRDFCQRSHSRCVRRQSVCWAFWLASLVLRPSPVTAQDAKSPHPSADLYRRARQASVEILVDDRLSGTGVFADRDGLVMTAGHVAGRPGARVEVFSPVAGRCRADVLAVNLGADLALLQVPPRTEGLVVRVLKKDAP